MKSKVLEKLRTGVLFLIKWRYLVALIIFAICVAFNLHGSSIAEYNKMFNYSESYNAEGIVLGESRAIRSDEWIVHTPYYMSQVYNDFAKDSNMMSLEGQDMIVGYNAPVGDITAIVKPFTWGYFLFGDERGLSWYWCSKLILLMLVTFELCMIVTKKNKKVSLLGMLMISFAPAVQWWFVPHMVDVFFWVMAVLVLAYHFFTSSGKWRALWMILLPCAVITFVLALFPSLQIATGLAMIGLFIGLMIRDKEEITFKKRDIWRIVAMGAFVLAVLGYTILTSWDAIMALLHTVYPGSRVALGGGGGFKALFTDLTSFTLPFKEITYANNCEISTFIHFAPMFLMLYPVIYKRMKRDRNMIVGNALVICLVVMGAFMLVGFPELLAKITGFSYINRMGIAYGLVATIFTIWGINMIWQNKILNWRQILGALFIYGFSYVCFVGKNELTYLSWWHYAVIIVGLLVLGYLMLKGHQKMFLVGMTALVVISGMTVNPVARGVSALFGHPLEQKIHEMAEEDGKAYWLAVADNKLASLGIVNGARMLNATNFYPDYEKWNLIDPEKEYDEVYNRYAHINVVLTEGETKIDLMRADSMKLELGCKDLRKWPVKYLVTAGKLTSCKEDYEKIYADSEGEYYIYERIISE